MPDWWEVAFNLKVSVNDSFEDIDNDGLTNYQEYLLGTNPRMDDSDQDGIIDGDDANPTQYDVPKNPILNRDVALTLGLSGLLLSSGSMISVLLKMFKRRRKS